MNTPISFEIAKLLKEKGFDTSTKNYYEYALKSKKDKQDGYSGSFGWKKGELNLQSHYFQNNSESDFTSEMWYMCSAPTIAEVIMWLYKKYGIWVNVDMAFEEKQIGFWYCIRQSKIDDVAIQSNDYPSPTEAYEVGISYTLKKIL